MSPLGPISIVVSRGEKPTELVVSMVATGHSPLKCLIRPSPAFWKSVSTLIRSAMVPDGSIGGFREKSHPCWRLAPMQVHRDRPRQIYRAGRPMIRHVWLISGHHAQLRGPHKGLKSNIGRLLCCWLLTTEPFYDDSNDEPLSCMR